MSCFFALLTWPHGIEHFSTVRLHKSNLRSAGSATFLRSCHRRWPFRPSTDGWLLLKHPFRTPCLYFSCSFLLLLANFVNRATPPASCLEASKTSLSQSPFSTVCSLVHDPNGDSSLCGVFTGLLRLYTFVTSIPFYGLLKMLLPWV